MEVRTSSKGCPSSWDPERESRVLKTWPGVQMKEQSGLPLTTCVISRLLFSSCKKWGSLYLPHRVAEASNR